MQATVEEGDKICNNLEKGVIEGDQEDAKTPNLGESLVKYCVARWRLVTVEAYCNS